jgi:hypothetical protein
VATNNEELMLSPVESLGLCGKTLDNRVRRAVQHVADSTLLRVADRLRSDALANDVIYERDGIAEPVRIMLRPRMSAEEIVTNATGSGLDLAPFVRHLDHTFDRT